MAKSRRKSRVAKRRKRDANFIKGPVRKRRRSHARTATAAAPRRRRKRAAAPAAAPRRKRRRSAARAAAAAPRRKRRSRRRARAADWKGDRAGHKRAARKGWRRKKRCAPVASRRRRRRARASDWKGDRAGHARAARKGWSRKRRLKAKRRRVARRNFGHSSRRSSGKRRSKARKSRKSSRRSSYGRVSRREREEYQRGAYGYEKYALSNPLSGGELVLIGITGVVGYGLADFVGRYLSTAPVTAGMPVNSLPPGQTIPNDQATMAFPSWTSMGAQLGIAAVPMIGSAFVDSPWGRAALQGMGLGAGFALFGNLFKSFMANMLSNSALGQQLYLAEIEAQAAVGNVAGTAPAPAPAPAPASPPAPLQGLPRGVGRAMLRAPNGMGQAQRRPTASALPIGVPPGTQRIRTMAPGGIMTNSGDVLPTPQSGARVPGGPATGPQCAPCTSTSGGIAATYLAAEAAIRDDSCLSGLPGGQVGLGMYQTFPEEDAA